MIPQQLSPRYRATTAVAGGILGTFGALFISAGIVPALVGTGAVVLSLVFGPIIGISAGSLGLFVALESPTGLAMISVGVMLGTAMLVPLEVRPDRWSLIVGGASFIGLTSVFGIAVDSGVSTSVSLAVIGGIVVLLGYTLHRYQLVQLGLLEENVRTNNDRDDETNT